MSVAATDSLSFDELYLAMPEGLSVIVGPNGSGKTNLGRAPLDGRGNLWGPANKVWTTGHDRLVRGCSSVRPTGAQKINGPRAGAAQLARRSPTGC
jgi:hypothetical protein